MMNVASVNTPSSRGDDDLSESASNTTADAFYIDENSFFTLLNLLWDSLNSKPEDQPPSALP